MIGLAQILVIDHYIEQYGKTAERVILDLPASNQENQSTSTGKLLTTQPNVKPNCLSWITYDETDILQARGTVVICCPVDLLSYSAMTRYVIREDGPEEVFRQRLVLSNVKFNLAPHQRLSQVWQC